MSFIYDMSDSWNNAGTTFTAIKMNVTNSASAVGSKLIDLQIGGTSLFVVGKSGNVGIGTASPSNQLSVNSNGTSTISLDWSGDNAAKASISANHVTGEVRYNAVTNYFPTFYSNNSERMRIDANGNIGVGTTSITGNATNRVIVSQGADSANVIVTKTGAQSGSLVAFDVGILVGSDTNHPLLFKTNATERMRLDTSGNLGIGTSSPRNPGAGYQGIVLNGSTSGFLDLNTNGTRILTMFGLSNDIAFANPTATGAMAFYTNNSERLRLDSAGNLGLGVTPSAWGSTSRALQFPTGAIEGRGAGLSMNANAYFNGSNWIYSTSAGAALYNMTNGSDHQWYVAASGTAGNAITFTQAMTLPASGNLGVGAASPAQAIHVSRATAVKSAIRFDNSVVTGSMFGTDIDGSLYAYQNGAYPFLIYTNAAERIRVTSTGDVGIGTSSPVAKLDVNGNISNSGTITSNPSGTYRRTLDNTGLTIVCPANATGQILLGQTGIQNWVIANIGTSGNLSIGGNIVMTTQNNVSIGTASLATNATNGFPYIPTCAGTPTGTPTAITGYAPMVVDSTNNKLYVYVGGAWQAMN